MQISASLRIALVFLAGAVPTHVFAQFQQPTPEELKMTADPKAPGAAAVYLNFEEVANDPLHDQTVYARIKVLSEKGKELGDVEVPYLRGGSKITNIKARTIHSDGTIFPLEGKAEDIMVVKNTAGQINRRVIPLPSVEVGSILEFRYDLRLDDTYMSPHWEIQKNCFVHKAHYAFTPFKSFQKGQQAQTDEYLVDQHGTKINSLLWWSVLPPGVQVKTDATGRFSLDVADIPPIPREEWMPPISSFLYKVNFYYMTAFGGSDFWVSEAARWSKEVDHFAEPTQPIRDAVASLVAPADNELTKAKKLYKAVQALENTDFTRKMAKVELEHLGLRAQKRAEDTWAQKSGSRDDIALLYLAMVRAAGLTAYAMKVVDRDEGAFAPGYFDFDQLDDEIVLLTLNGKEVPLDPGEKMCAFEGMSWKHSGAGGIRQSADGRAAAISPQQLFAVNTLYRGGDINFDEHGAATGDFTFSMTGQEALRWRQASLRDDPAELKRSFDEWLASMVPEGIEAHLHHFVALEDPEVNLIAMIKVKGSLGSTTSKRVMLPGFFFATRNSHPFIDQAERQLQVDMHYAEQVNDEVTYHLPAGMVVEGAPQETKIPWEGHAVFTTKTETDTGELTMTRELKRSFTFVKPEEYQSLVDFYRKMATADQQLVVLAAGGAGQP